MSDYAESFLLNFVDIGVILRSSTVAITAIIVLRGSDKDSDLSNRLVNLSLVVRSSLFIVRLSPNYSFESV